MRLNSLTQLIPSLLKTFTGRAIFLTLIFASLSCASLAEPPQHDIAATVTRQQDIPNSDDAIVTVDPTELSPHDPSVDGQNDIDRDSELDPTPAANDPICSIVTELDSDPPSGVKVKYIPCSVRFPAAIEPQPEPWSELDEMQILFSTSHSANDIIKISHPDLPIGD